MGRKVFQHTKRDGKGIWQWEVGRNTASVLRECHNWPGESSVVGKGKIERTQSNTHTHYRRRPTKRPVSVRKGGKIETARPSASTLFNTAAAVRGRERERVWNRENPKATNRSGESLKLEDIKIRFKCFITPNNEQKSESLPIWLKIGGGVGRVVAWQW